MPNQRSDTVLKVLPSWTSDSHCSHPGGNTLSFRLGLAHDHRLLFEPTDFTLHDVTALCGVNGSGKTSLARTLNQLPGFPNDFVVEFVSTEEDVTSGCSPIEYLRQAVDTRLEGLRAQMNDLENASDSDNVEEAANKLAELYEREEEFVESSEREMQQALDALGFAPHLEKTLSQLSSGWRYKCRLIVAFLLQPNLLIIDEPSFLDAASLEWLIRRIKQLAASSIVLLISHKDALLEAVTDRVLYINAENKTLTTYNCGYSEFRSLLETQRSHARRVTTEAARQQQQAQTSLQTLQKQLKHREKNLKATTLQSADQRFIKGKNKEAKQKADRSAASKVKQLQKQTVAMEELSKQAQSERVKPLRIDGKVSAGILATFEQVSLAYNHDDDPVFSNVDAQLGPTDHVLLRGPNGCGKSSLVRLILGELEPTQGKVIRQGKVLYFPQTALSDMMHFHGRESAVNYLGDDLTETQARQHLGNFGLARDLALRPIASLSAGQRVRLWLASQVRQHPKPSLLILDEISENVDFQTRKSLIELLHSFVGATLVISHDEDFCESFQPSQIWTLGPHGLFVEYNQ